MHIRKLIDSSGAEVTEAKSVLKHIKGFYSDLYKRRAFKTEEECFKYLESINMPQLNEFDRNRCEGIITKRECWDNLRIQWVKRLTNNNFHSWKIIPTVLLKDVGGVSLFHSNLALSYACKLKIDNYPEFYKSIVLLWIKISPTDPQSERDILSQTLWSNKFILIKRKPIFF